MIVQWIIVGQIVLVYLYPTVCWVSDVTDHELVNVRLERNVPERSDSCLWQKTTCMEVRIWSISNMQDNNSQCTQEKEKFA